MKVPIWLNPSRIWIKEYTAAFCATVFLAVVLLAAAAFLPQTAIRNHAADSIGTLERHIADPTLFDHSIASTLPVSSELLILRTSLSTDTRYLGSILTNPVYEYDDLEGWSGSVETFARLSYDMPTDSVWFYARYWMGFRVIMRLALTFFTYAQIKRYMSFLFLGLFAAVICSVSKHANSRIAFLFALSIILVRPHVMATSMQLTCCFFIAFTAMLLIPWIHRHQKWEGLFFMEVGMLTMYFDFYTVPLVTLGFPLLYLCVLKQEASVPFSWKQLFRNMAVWFVGYGFMWIAKLSLTSLLTSVNALQQGLQSLFSRVGIQKDTELEKFYSVKAAFDGIREALFSDEAGMAVYLLCAGIIFVTVLVKVFMGRVTLAKVRDAVPYLFLAVIPLLWFVITKQPIAIHSYFQYRTIALTHWAAGMFLYYLLPAKSKVSENKS